MKIGFTGSELFVSAEEAFPNVAEYGAKAASIHPLFQISSKTESYRELSNSL